MTRYFWNRFSCNWNSRLPGQTFGEERSLIFTTYNVVISKIQTIKRLLVPLLSQKTGSTRFKVNNRPVSNHDVNIGIEESNNVGIIQFKKMTT